MTQPHEGGVTAQRNSASSTQRQPAKPASPLPVLTSETQTPRHDEPASKGGDGPNWAEWGLVLVTAILAWFTYRLWRATGKLVTEAKETAERQLRAYLSFKATHLGALAPPGAKETTFIANGLLTNYGQTPAYDIDATGCLAVGSAENPDITVPEESRVTGILGPKADTSVYHRPLPVSHAVAIQVRDATVKQLYYTGAVTYRDTFGSRWRLRFRFRVHFDVSGATAFLATTDHNDEEKLS